MVDRPIEIILIGGSAMSYLGLKEETFDVDFLFEGVDSERMIELTDQLEDEYETRIDMWTTDGMLIQANGRINLQKLPSDYQNMCQEVNGYENLRVRILSPIDIILTKVGRLAEKDIADITQLIKKYKPTRKELQERFNLYVKGYDGNPATIKQNFKSLLGIFYE